MTGGGRLKIRVGVSSDVGRVRERNEDAYLAEEPLFAVADGMGGHRGGEVASRVALDTVERRHREADGAPDLVEVVRSANRAVLERAEGKQELEGMGTTLTLAIAEDDRVRVAHVGDSRAYLLRDGELRRLTEDHTLVNRMVSEGKLTEEEALNHPHRSILTRALGVDAEIEVDLAVQDVGTGDRLLLCSDGLTSMVPEEEILAILTEQKDPQTASDALVEAANRAGGQDNITAVVFDFVREESAGPPETEIPGEAPPEAPPRDEAAPTGEPAGPPGRRWRRVVLWTAVAVVLVVGALVGVRIYIDSQWFVAAHEGRVALFRGIPTKVLGYELSGLVDETSIPADDAARLGPWRELRDGITADSEEEARALIRQIDRDVREAEREAQEPKPGRPGAGREGGGG